jgi:heme-binding protein
MIRKISGIAARGRIAGVGAGLLLTGLATIAAPTAAAAPDCSADRLANTVSSVTGSARQYLANHPGANEAVTAAFGQPRPQAAATLRGYFTTNPQE